MSKVEIPTKDYLKSLCTIKKEDALEKIVAKMKLEASFGRTIAYINFTPDRGMNDSIAEEIKNQLKQLGYSVNIFKDTSYRNEGTSFTILWS